MRTEVVEYEDGGQVLARYIPSGIAWNAGLNFFSDDSDFIQAGIWGYNRGTCLNAHIHNEVVRQVLWTQEVIFVRSGKLEAVIYGISGRIVAKVLMTEGDIIIMLRGGHGYNILEDNTSVLEVKNGPYPGASEDRRKL